MTYRDFQTGPSAKIRAAIFNELAKLGHNKASIFKGAGVDCNALDSALSCALSNPSADESSLSANEQSTVFNYACCLLASETSNRQHQSSISNGFINKSFIKKEVTDMLLYCVITCKDLAEVIERTSTYCSLVESIGISIKMVAKGPLIEVRIDIGRESLDLPSMLLTAAAMSTLYHLFSWITATNLKLSTVGLCYQHDDFSTLLGAFQGQPLHYNQTHNHFTFPSAYLNLPVARTYQQLTQVIDYFPDNLVMSSSGDLTFAARVRAIVDASLAGNSPPINLDIAAQLINTSSVTLRRRLRSEGTSFSQILTACQHNEAEKQLSTQMPIKTIALHLGFSDDRAFRRAFKRWSGQAPTEFRSQCKASTR